MSNKQGPPKHQNNYAWKPNAGRKINETEVGGRLKPLSEITGVCQRCKEQIDWKRRYGKYKPLTEPAKCQKCSKRTVRQAYHNLCTACAKEQKVCAKCRCHVDRIIGRDLADVEAEQKTLEEAIKNARERDRRALIRAMNKGKPMGLTKNPTNEGNRVGDLFPSSSLEEYAAKGRDRNRSVNGNKNLGDGEDVDDDDVDDEEEGEEDNESENGENNEDLDGEDNPEHQNENGDKACH